MLKYLIQVIEKTCAEALLCALLFAVLRPGEGRRKCILAASAAGTVCALVLALVRYTTTLIKREWWNTGILAAAIIAGIVFTALAHCRKNKGGASLPAETPLSGTEGASAGGITVSGAFAVCVSALAGVLLFYILPDVFYYPTEFVMIGESVFSTNFLVRAAGYMAGLILVFLSASALFRAAAELPFKAVRPVLTGGLVLLMIRQAAAIVQVLYARRLIPRSRLLFTWLTKIINHNNLFIYAIMILTAVLPVLLWIKSMHKKETPANPAERRKDRAAGIRQRRRSAGIIAGYALALVSLTALRSYDRREAVLSPPEPMEIAGDEIIIPYTTIDDGKLHRFMWTASNGTEVRFIVIRKNESAWGVGLDACDICGPTGYYERKDGVICKLCDVVMNKNTIGFKGGCNPVPLAYRIQNAAMVIQTEDLENEKGRFK